MSEKERIKQEKKRNKKKINSRRKCKCSVVYGLRWKACSLLHIARTHAPTHALSLSLSLFVMSIVYRASVDRNGKGPDALMNLCGAPNYRLILWHFWSLNQNCPLRASNRRQGDSGTSTTYVTKLVVVITMVIFRIASAGTSNFLLPAGWTTVTLFSYLTANARHASNFIILITYLWENVLRWNPMLQNNLVTFSRFFVLRRYLYPLIAGWLTNCELENIGKW